MVRRILTPTEARALQVALNAHGASLVVDDHFGELSKLALIQFQHRNAMPETGNPDPATLAALGIPDLFAPPQKPARKPGLTDMLAIAFTLFTSKGKPMKWSTIEQLIRIAAYSGGGVLFGQQIADGQMFQAAIGGLIAVGAFVWWLVFERNRPKA